MRMWNDADVVEEIQVSGWEPTLRRLKHGLLRQIMLANKKPAKQIANNASFAPPCPSTIDDSVRVSFQVLKGGQTVATMCLFLMEVPVMNLRSWVLNGFDL